MLEKVIGIGAVVYFIYLVSVLFDRAEKGRRQEKGFRWWNEP